VLLLIGDDWAEDHHDVEIEDETGNTPKPWRHQLNGSCSVDLGLQLSMPSTAARLRRPEPGSRLAVGHP